MDLLPDGRPLTAIATAAPVTCRLRQFQWRHSRAKVGAIDGGPTHYDFAVIGMAFLATIASLATGREINEAHSNRERS